MMQAEFGTSITPLRLPLLFGSPRTFSRFIAGSAGIIGRVIKPERTEVLAEATDKDSSTSKARGAAKLLSSSAKSRANFAFEDPGLLYSPTPDAAICWPSPMAGSESPSGAFSPSKSEQFLDTAENGGSGSAEAFDVDSTSSKKSRVPAAHDSPTSDLFFYPPSSVAEGGSSKAAFASGMSDNPHTEGELEAMFSEQDSNSGTKLLGMKGFSSSGEFIERHLLTESPVHSRPTGSVFENLSSLGAEGESLLVAFEVQTPSESHGGSEGEAVVVGQGGTDNAKPFIPVFPSCSVGGNLTRHHASKLYLTSTSRLRFSPLCFIVFQIVGLLGCVTGLSSLRRRVYRKEVQSSAFRGQQQQRHNTFMFRILYRLGLLLFFSDPVQLIFEEAVNAPSCFSMPPCRRSPTQNSGAVRYSSASLEVVIQNELNASEMKALRAHAGRLMGLATMHVRSITSRALEG
ncbi:hypothetical protein Efla_000749 [Eimeria flavescens]